MSRRQNCLNDSLKKKQRTAAVENNIIKYQRQQLADDAGVIK